MEEDLLLYHVLGKDVQITAFLERYAKEILGKFDKEDAFYALEIVSLVEIVVSAQEGLPNKMDNVFKKEIQESTVHLDSSNRMEGVFVLLDSFNKMEDVFSKIEE